MAVLKGRVANETKTQAAQRIAANLRTIRAAIAKAFPEHAATLGNDAATLAGWRFTNSRKRTAAGHTPHNVRLALLWCSIRDRIQAGEDEADVLADVSAKNHIREDSLDDLWKLNGRPAIRAILRTYDSSAEKINRLIELTDL